MAPSPREGALSRSRALSGGDGPLAFGAPRKPTYRNPDVQAPGCVTHWEVLGGRTPYQIALERDESGRHHWHCTCADAVYRAEEQGRVCKHVEGLFAFGPPLPRPTFIRRSA